MIIQTWQPEQLGTSFASDGYVWIGPETAYTLPLEKYGDLHIYHQTAGYAPGDPVATHARRRYRIVPRNAGQGPADPQLWITHYFPAESQDRIATSAVPPDMRTQQTMQIRAYLQVQGQIAMKEFMLKDQNKWPPIGFPGRSQQNQMASRTPQVPIGMAYPIHQMTPGPASKRARTQSGQPQAVSQMVEVFDDEEDTSRGDMFDHLTPREIAESRYKLNHEFMEEVVASAVPTNHIVPVDLGLGLGGSLKSVTDGIFETYDTIKHASDPSKEYVGKLDPGMKEQFRKRAEERMASDRKQMEKEVRRHARRMAKLEQSKALREAEMAMRTAVADPTDTGSEIWRLEGRVTTPDDDDDEAADKAQAQRSTKKVEDIVKEIERSLGLSTAAINDMKRVQDGGLQEIAPPAPQPEIFTPMASVPQLDQERHTGPGTPHGGLLVGDHDLEMGSAAGLLDQYHAGFSAATTPGNSYTPQHIPGMSAVNSTVASPMPSAQSPVYGQGMQQQHAPQHQRADIEMGGTDNSHSATGDWVVVPKPGVSPKQAQHQAFPAQAQALSHITQAAQPPRPTPPPILPPGYARQSLSHTPAAPSPSSMPPAPSAQSPSQAPAPPAQAASASPAPSVSKPPPILPPGITVSASASHQGSAAPTPTTIPQPHVAGAAASPAVPSPAQPSPAPAQSIESANTGTPLYNSASEPVDFSGLDDLGTGFDGDMDMGGMGMDDSAFGEAFHGVEPRAEEGQNDESTL